MKKPLITKECRVVEVDKSIFHRLNLLAIEHFPDSFRRDLYTAIFRIAIKRFNIREITSELKAMEEENGK